MCSRTDLRLVRQSGSQAGPWSQVLRGCLLAWTLMLGVPVAAADNRPPSGESVFFAFDDQSIPWTHNLKLTLVQPDKHPDNPVLRCGPKGSPDFGHAILYGTVLKQGDKFRMWYLGMIQRELEAGQAPGWWRPMCYAESADGIHWTKPALNLVELNGNTQNNICLIEGKVPSMTLVNDFLSILYEPEDPDPARRYKAAYIAHMPYADIQGGMSQVGVKEGRVGAFITATSADGLRWKVVGDRPANAGGERFEVSSLYRFGQRYYASGQLASPWCWLNDGRAAGRVMMTYRSPDFLHWSKAKALSMTLPQQYTDPQPSLTEMLQGYSKQMHMGVGVWNRGNVLVGLHGIWQGQPPGAKGHQGLRIDLGLAVSNNGIHFREPVPNFLFMEHGAAEDWDSIALLQGHAFVNEGDKTYLWYSHWDCEEKFRSQEIGLATLRRDGFGYLSRHDAGDPGFLVTSTQPAGDIGVNVFVNVSGVSAESPLTVELVDDQEQPIPGYSGDDAVRVTADGTRQHVKWRSASNGRTPARQPYAVRIGFPDDDRPRLYAVYFTP